MSKHTEPVLAGCYLRYDSGQERREHYCELTSTRLRIYHEKEGREEELKLETISRVRTKTTLHLRPIFIGTALLLSAWFLSENFQLLFGKPMYSYALHSTDPDTATLQRASYRAELQLWENQRDQTTWIVFALSCLFLLGGLRRKVLLTIYTPGNMRQLQVYHRTREFLNFYHLLETHRRRMITE